MAGRFAIKNKQGGPYHFVLRAGNGRDHCDVRELHDEGCRAESHRLGQGKRAGCARGRRDGRDLTQRRIWDFNRAASPKVTEAPAIRRTRTAGSRRPRTTRRSSAATDVEFPPAAGRTKRQTRLGRELQLLPRRDLTRSCRVRLVVRTATRRAHTSAGH